MRADSHADTGELWLILKCLSATLVVATLLSLELGSLWAQGQMGGVIAGRIIAGHGLPGRLQVQLAADADVLAEETYTDSNGNYGFTNLPSGRYSIIIQAEGFRPVHQVVVLDLTITTRLQADIVLEPVDPESKSPRQTISVNPNELNAKSKPASFNPKAVREFDKGNKLQKEENLREAVAHYQKALSIAPDFYPALANVGAVYLRQKDTARAEDAFRRALELNPEDGESYINLGHALYEEGKYQPAIERLEEGLKRSPRSAVGHFLAGSAWLKVGQLDKAERDLKIAYSLDPPGMARARLQLANVYLRRNDRAAAGAELEGYLQANPSDPQASAIKKMLADLKAR